MKPPSLVVLPAKTRRPKVPGRAIRRDRLFGIVDGVLDAPVTLITAPSGFGKSWLLSAWLDQNSRTPSAWVTIDQHDSDPERLWAHLVDAVAGAELGEAANRAETLLHSSGSGWPVIVDALSAGLGQRREHVILVLDDVHKLTGSQSPESITHLIRYLPENVHLVLVGRHDPPVPLAQRRALGELLEIRTSDLRCTQTESVALVEHTAGLSLPAQAVEELRERSMGWMAGIRLAAAAAAAASGEDAVASAQRFETVGTADGAYETLGTYLIEEVVADLDESQRSFLLETSVLGELSAGLCDFVAQRTDSARQLDRLAREGFFTTQTGVSPGLTYRYHDLLREALLKVLRRSAPAREADLHRRAAAWLRDADDPVGAFGHAVAAGSLDDAERILIETSSDLLASRQIDLLVSLFEDLDSRGADLHPSTLAAWTSANLYSSRSAEEIDRVLDRTRKALRDLGSDRAQFEADLRVHAEEFNESADEFRLAVESVVAHRRGDVQLALAAYRDLDGRPSEGGWIEAAAGEALISQEKYSEGLALTDAYHEYCLAAQNEIIGVVNLAHSLSIVALGRIGLGQLNDVDALVDHAVSTLTDRGLADRPQMAIALLPGGWAAWERGELGVALQTANSVLAGAQRLGEAPAEVVTRALLARVHFSMGDLPAAVRELEGARMTAGGHSLTESLDRRVTHERVRLHGLAGDLPGADVVWPDWRKRLHTGGRTMTEHLLLCRLARWVDIDQAESLLAHPPEDQEVTDVHRIERHKLAALLAQDRKDPESALVELTSGMRIAAHTGHRQTFLDEADAFGVLLDNAAARSGLLLRPHGIPHLVGGTMPAPTLYEPLSERELEVLRLLQTNLTYREIGAQMYLSPNTVKSYVKNVYRKLDVDRRNGAVSAARGLGLLG